MRSRNKVEIKEKFYEKIDLLIDIKETESAKKVYWWKFNEKIH